MRRRGWGLGGLLFFPPNSIFPAGMLLGGRVPTDGRTDSPSSPGVPNLEDSRGAGLGPLCPHSLFFFGTGGCFIWGGGPQAWQPPRGRGAVLIGLLRGAAGAGKRSHDSLIAVFIQIVSRQLQTLPSPHIGDPSPGQIRFFRVWFEYRRCVWGEGMEVPPGPWEPFGMGAALLSCSLLEENGTCVCAHVCVGGCVCTF